MRIITDINSMRKIALNLKSKRKTIGFVPTMGALHQGHLSLIRKAGKENDFIVVSIFINPIQFGPKEDFRRYPRPIKNDFRLCRRDKVDFIFYPAAADIYPRGYSTYVSVSGLSEVLCGKFRPGHFRGVTTIVTKLFNIVQPNIAYFGQKDAQQAVLVKKIVEDLNMPLKIKIMPTRREKDGLAMSSRNIYLNTEERQRALVLYRALLQAKGLVRSGCRKSAFIINSLRNIISPAVDKIDYLKIVDADTLCDLKQVKDRAMVMMAVRVGKIRLIDNAIVR